MIKMTSRAKRKIFNWSFPFNFESKQLKYKILIGSRESVESVDRFNDLECQPMKFIL